VSVVSLYVFSHGIGIYSFAETPFDPTTGRQLDVGGRAEIMMGRGSFTESFPLFGQDLADYDVIST
jgi:hypothetical protein